MEYLYAEIENNATFTQNTAERIAFAGHLKLVAKALHDIEWVDSGDYGPGDETEAVRACLSDGAVLDVAVGKALEAIKAMRQELDRACSGRTGPAEKSAELLDAVLKAVDDEPELPDDLSIAVYFEAVVKEGGVSGLIEAFRKVARETKASIRARISSLKMKEIKS